MDQAEELRRLRWQCRRGMLELDLIFNRFLDSGFSSLTEQDKSDFARLLSYQDQVLQDWFFGQAVPADARLRDLVSAIRRSSR